MMSKMRMVAVLVAASGLVGCASVPNQDLEAKKTEEQRQMDRALQQRLAESAASINATLSQIEKIERGSVGGPNGYQPGAEPDHAIEKKAADDAAAAAAAAAAKDPLDAHMKIVWKNGTADELLRKLAEQIGAVFKTSGTPKKDLPIMSVEFDGMTARDILQSIGQKVDAYADVVYVASPKPATLELRYK